MQEVSPYVVTGRALLGEDLREEDVTITVSGGGRHLDRARVPDAR